MSQRGTARPLTRACACRNKGIVNRIHYDLHYQTAETAKKLVTMWVNHAVATRSNVDMEIIVGKGHHSKGGLPVLKGTVLAHLRTMSGIVSHAAISPLNTGVIVAKIRPMDVQNCSKTVDN
mmetsp:Transcript_26428/g.74374  ORF Transcript_26428/g.74374 Transcript_26428/m.74374 type:complete len:121 (-) Transcript_26428:54-416(-)